MFTANWAVLNERIEKRLTKMSRKNAVKTHYHVIESTPGYMPESDPGVFTSKKAAQGYALDLARDLRNSGYKVSGSMSTGYYGELDPSDLGRIVEIYPCNDDCEIEDN